MKPEGAALVISDAAELRTICFEADVGGNYSEAALRSLRRWPASGGRLCRWHSTFAPEPGPIEALQGSRCALARLFIGEPCRQWSQHCVACRALVRAVDTAGSATAFSFEDAPAAIAAVENRKAVGKIAIKVGH